MSPGGAGPVAVAGCGTNSTRLLVADGAGNRLQREMRVTRLGEAVDATRFLAPDAIARTVAALEEYARAASAWGARLARIVTTSAARDADNRDEFLDAVAEAVGVRPAILGGDDEARLSFRSATAKLDAGPGPCLVVDLGGGSTELAYGAAAAGRGDPDVVRSVDVGCVRLTERLLRGGPPGAAALSDARSAVRASLADSAGDLRGAGNAGDMVLLAGTVTRVALVRERLTPVGPSAAHGFGLRRDALEELVETLTTAGQGDSAPASPLDAALADVILGGAVILAELMRFVGFEECLVSDADILDGLVLSLLPADVTG